MEAGNTAVIDLLEIFYWRVFGMGKFEACDQESHIHKNEVLAMLEDAIHAIKGE